MVSIQDLEGPSTPGSAKFDELLDVPTDAMDVEASYPRATATCSVHNQKYRIAQRVYDRQYAQLYFARLRKLTPSLQARTQALWPGVSEVKILDVPEDVEVVVVGTVFKEMRLKPTILDEYSKDKGLKAALGGTNFCSDDDSIALEDDGARMPIQGQIPIAALVTGVVMAVRGINVPGENFTVNDVLFAEMAPQPERPIMSEDKYVALISGLELGSPTTNVLQVQMAIDFLTGALGSPAEQRLASQIVRLIIAGGTVGQTLALAGPTAYSKAGQQNTALQPIKDMDMYMSELAAAMPVDVMPGAADPTNVALPQQPLHRCLFPACGSYTSLSRVTNPHEQELDGVRLLGMSGQNVDDIAKYAVHDDRLSMLEHCLRWRHLAPTAPETLTCYPFSNFDPFILTESPHVLFVGNQPAFATDLVDSDPDASGASFSVRTICVPSFCKTGMLVLLNLRTLQCHPMTFAGGGNL